MNVLRIALVLLTVLSVSLLCSGKPRDPHFCRKYPFAPRCRGAGAKRDLQKLEPLLEEPRPREYHLNEKFLSDYDINDSFIPKINTRAAEEVEEYI